jgi:hypothetical protein
MGKEAPRYNHAANNGMPQVVESELRQALGQCVKCRAETIALALRLPILIVPCGSWLL